MITTRGALLLIRILIGLVAVTYSALQLFLATEARPLFALTVEEAATVSSPLQTNPVFAEFLILIAMGVGAVVAVLTTKSLISDIRKFGHPAPFSPPTELVFLNILSSFSVYYFVVSVLIGGRWFYTLTLALLGVALSVYEGRQYADSRAVKVHPMVH